MENAQLGNETNQRYAMEITHHMATGHFMKAWNGYVELCMVGQHGESWRLVRPPPSLGEKVVITLTLIFGIVFAGIMIVCKVIRVTVTNALQNDIFQEVGALLTCLRFLFIKLRNVRNG